MANFMNRAAVSLATALSVFAAQAQDAQPANTFSNIYKPLPAAPTAQGPLTLEEKCRGLLAVAQPQKTYPKTGKAYLEAGNIACGVTKSPGGQWLLTSVYNLETIKDAKRLNSDDAASSKQEERLLRKETSQEKTQQRAAEFKERHEARKRGEPHRVTDTSHLIGNPGTRRPLGERSDIPATGAPEGQRRHNAPIATPQ